MNFPDLAAADHWILSLDPAPSLACTQFVRPHVTVSFAAAGRAVLFPGSELLVGTLSVASVVALTAIDRVDVLGSGPAADDTLVETGDFVRPQFAGDELVLVTTPAAGGVLVPFERRDPTPCCAGH
jgi:hypothetical protein